MSIGLRRFEFSRDMSLREKIAQLVFVRIGSNLPPVRTVEQDEERVLRLLEVCPVGGLLLFNGGPDTKRALARLQAASKVPLLVGTDAERGVGQQVKGYTLFPHAMALGRGAGVGIDSFLSALVQESRDVGIHIVFGPVADINTNPLNPIISIRAFSEDVGQVTELTARYVKTAEEAGLLTTAKHFPGHGDTYQDSHDSLPSVDRSLDELRKRELVPFRAAIDAGCSLVMTAHIAFPNIDPTGVPATLSPVFLQDVLRKEMGFAGAVCSDSLLMAGVRDQFATEGELALAALNAGVDVLLDFDNPISVIEHLMKSVDDGALDERRIDEALDRVWRLKTKVFESNVGASKTISGGPSFVHDAREPARRAIKTLHSNRPALPFSADDKTAVILLKPFETAIEPPEQPLGAAVRELFRDATYVQLGPRSDEAAYRLAGDLARSAKQAVVAMIVRPAAWHAYGLRSEQVEFVKSVIGERQDAVLVSLGAPYALDDYPNAAMRICTYSDVPVSQQALAEFLVGK
jgi:beta-glucosidase-like glycosyl hydrolase